MSKWVSDVVKFRKAVGLPKGGTPDVPVKSVREKALRLICEEASEFIKASNHKNIPEVADALIDLIYVCIQAGIEWGIPLDRCWDEVQRANMAKKGGPVRGDGKILKPEGWTPPDIDGIICNCSEKRGQKALR